MSSSPFRTLAANDVLTLNIAVTAAHRARLMGFVRDRFHQHFGAEVDDDSPTLVGAFDGRGVLVGAFGLRDNASGFFCEHYLETPVQETLRQHTGHAVERHEIIELTHLCAVRPGCLGHLMALLPGALLDLGYRYLTCTATACLAAYFERRGLRAMTLGPASADALPPGQRGRWGSYYAAEPRVLAGDIGQALAPTCALARAGRA